MNDLYSYGRHPVRTIYTSLFNSKSFLCTFIPLRPCLAAGRSVFFFLRILITLSCSLAVSLNESYRFRFQKSSMVLYRWIRAGRSDIPCIRIG